MARYREATPPGPWGGGDDSELDVFGAERYFNGDDALWCARSSSSFSSAFRTTGTTHDRTVTAATSSSEASWNSRSALLPDGKVNVLAAADIAAPSVVEAVSRGTGSDEPPREKPSPSSHLRRWLLGVAGCACVGGHGEESESADEVYREEAEDDNVIGVGGNKHTSEGGEVVLQTTGQRREGKELAVVETTSARVRPGRWLGDGEGFLAGKAEIFPVRATNSGEFSTLIIKPATTAAFTIVAGNTACGGGCYTSEDDVAPSELGCAYPPSEASVVWSVVTADGAASCNFSSAASGYYSRFNGREDADARSNRRRRSRVRSGGGGGLLTCMGDKAVNAIGPARWPEVEPASAGRLGRRCGRVKGTLM